MQKNVLLIGAPGAGKGTTADHLIDQYGLVSFSTGDALREVMKGLNTKFAHFVPIIKSETDKGNLVPDKIMQEIICDKLNNMEAPNGFIFDGFPRNVEQINLFNSVLKENKLALHAVMCLEVAEEVLVKRIAGRQLCSNPDCKAQYNEFFMPSKIEGKCDRDGCNGDLVKRDDDKDPEVVKNRIKVYNNTTKPIVNYFRGDKSFYEINDYSTKKLPEIDMIMTRPTTLVTKEKNGIHIIDSKLVI